jgi:hypothetical protein
MPGRTSKRLDKAATLVRIAQNRPTYTGVRQSLCVQLFQAFNASSQPSRSNKDFCNGNLTTMQPH